MSNKYQKGCSISLIMKEIQIKTTWANYNTFNSLQKKKFKSGKINS